MKTNFLKSSLMVAMVAIAMGMGFVSCDDDDDVESTLNPA
ncbi:secreted protein, partial [gut metagenome]